MMKMTDRKILLRSCPRCRGDLFRDSFDDEFACLQCGRRISVESLEAQQKTLTLAA